MWVKYGMTQLQSVVKTPESSQEIQLHAHGGYIEISNLQSEIFNLKSSGSFSTQRGACPWWFSQAIPAGNLDAYQLLRARIREARTWSWANKKKTRLRHAQRPKGGYIEVSRANGVLIAHIRPKTQSDLFYLAEKFTGRLLAWFEGQLLAVNLQFVPEPPPRKRRRRR